MAPAAISVLQGTAIFERNRPVVGATVVVLAEAPDGETLLTTTDAKGRFRVDAIADGRYTVEFQRMGLQTVRKAGVDLKAPFRPTVEVILRPGPAPAAPPPAPASGSNPPFDLIGRVTDRGGNGMADVRIRLVPPGAAADPLDVESSDGGDFAAARLVPGRWTVETRGLAFLPIRAAVELRPGSRLRIVLVPQPAGFEPIPLDLLPVEEPVPPPEEPRVNPPGSAA
jgi:hypothetical protein